MFLTYQQVCLKSVTARTSLQGQMIFQIEMSEMKTTEPLGPDLQKSPRSLFHLSTATAAFVALLFQDEDESNNMDNK